VTNGEDIIKASLVALRSLTLEQLVKEREDIGEHIRAAMESAVLMIDLVIAEKQRARMFN
jgi:hypothetical protein